MAKLFCDETRCPVLIRRGKTKHWRMLRSS